jgi:hypothetical protein
MRTTDTASVLRVAGTFNFKDKAKPRDVKALTPPVEIGTGQFLQMLDKAITEAGVTVQAPPKLGGTPRSTTCSARTPCASTRARLCPSRPCCSAATR